jgi:acylphosphatase
VEVQGTSDQIEQFMYEIEHGNRYIRIRNIEKKQIPVNLKETRFGVRY